MSYAAKIDTNGKSMITQVFSLTTKGQLAKREKTSKGNSRFQPVEQLLARFDDLDAMFAAA